MCGNFFFYIPGAIGAYCASVTSASLYSAPATKLERVESLYGGTKSLYCKSPPLTRANLNRSQSVYAKSNTTINRDLLPRPGPLVPAQSLYPMRLNQQSHVQNQNVQNQMQQRSESIYGVRPGIAARNEPPVPSTSGYNRENNGNLYGTRNQPTGSSETSSQYDEKRRNRPESMYGMVNNQNQRRGQSAQSDDSSYGSYHGAATAPRNQSSVKNNNGGSGPTYNRQINGNDVRQSPPIQLLTTTTSYIHNRSQHSPNPQY